MGRSDTLTAGTQAPPLLRAVNATRGRIVAERVEWAGTSRTRRAGLLGRSGLEDGHGMYIVPCQWIHTFGMRFPIDVAFLDASHRVVAIHHTLRPNRLSRIALRAEGVLELPARTLVETGTRVGDVVELLSREG